MVLSLEKMLLRNDPFGAAKTLLLLESFIDVSKFFDVLISIEDQESSNVFEIGHGFDILLKEFEVL